MSSHDARVPVAAGTQSAPAAERTASTPIASGPASPAPVPGLTVGHAEDPAEHAADRMADSALDRLHRSQATAGASPDAHAHDPGCGHLRRSATPTPAATVGLAGGALDEASSDRIESARGDGAPLPDGVRRRMETGFGTSLGHVRVHDDAQASALSAGMSAEAFTTGNDIFFGAGRFAPQTPAGEQVLAHEIAHVLTEGGGTAPATTRRLFGKKKTPEEKAAKAAAKREEEAKAARVKQSKKTEKTEQASLKESRKQGIAGREALTTELYDTTSDAPQAPVSGKVNDAGQVPMAKDATSARVVGLTQRFDAALLREKEVFEQLKAKKLGGSDEKRAEIAYDQVWKGEYKDLNAVRPPRETAAERLVIQVRQARGEAAGTESAAEQEKAVLKVKMLPKEVEAAYERMVTHRNDLMKKDPKRSEVLAQDEAYELIKKGMPVKDQGLLPPKDGPLDQAAFTAAEGRVAARDKQAKRDASTIEENLMLLDPAKRAGAEKKPEHTQETLDTVKTVGSGVGLGKTVINGLGGGIAGMVGTKQDAGLRAQQGVVKDKEFTTHLPGVVDQGVGEAVRSGERANKQLATGQSSWKDQSLPQSDATKAKFGIGQVTGILSGLMTAVQSAMQMVESAQQAWSTKDPYEALKATKAGAVGLDGLVSVAKNSANLAKLIDSGVADGVKQVIPGLDIATSALAMVRGVTEVASAGMRQRETDLTMFEARAGSGEKVNVMVYPLMKVSQVYTKHLEQQCWSLGVSIINFSTSVAQVASAGGFGVPAAIKAATAVIDNLHKIAHYIASKLLNQMAKTAEKESAVMHLEGGAEDELKKHPKMAVDGIIMKAAAGDRTAQQFLSNYRIDGKPITPDYVRQIKPRPVKPFNPKAKPDAKEEQTSNDALLVKIRAVVLEGMDTNADPQSMFEDLKKKAKPVTGALAGVSEAWAETDELAQKRNQQAKDGKLGANTKTDRGLGWRIRQLFASENRGMLKEKTSALGKTESLPPGVVCVVGDLQLKDQASPPDIKKFTDSLTAQAIEAELKRTPRRNRPEWIEFLREALRNKSAKAAPSRPSSPAPVPVAP
ncbi:eCIS core domain-containing protein [Cellulomonas sp. McL0617]|uniref:eCIS core domain-containing protein n=1 Tax=Cellulomonas sp. McL0617 TaxID=3415675 RepID=UPI003CEF0BC2